MATYKKRRKTWRIKVRKLGVRLSATLSIFLVLTAITTNTSLSLPANLKLSSADTAVTYPSAITNILAVCALCLQLSSHQMDESNYPFCHL